MDEQNYIKVEKVTPHSAHVLGLHTFCHAIDILLEVHARQRLLEYPGTLVIAVVGRRLI